MCSPLKPVAEAVLLNIGDSAAVVRHLRTQSNTDKGLHDNLATKANAGPVFSQSLPARWRYKWWVVPQDCTS